MYLGTLKTKGGSTCSTDPRDWAAGSLGAGGEVSSLIPIKACVFSSAPQICNRCPHCRAFCVSMVPGWAWPLGDRWCGTILVLFSKSSDSSNSGEKDTEVQRQEVTGFKSANSPQSWELSPNLLPLCGRCTPPWESLAQLPFGT